MSLLSMVFSLGGSLTPPPPDPVYNGIYKIYGCGDSLMDKANSGTEETPIKDLYFTEEEVLAGCEMRSTAFGGATIEAQHAAWNALPFEERQWADALYINVGANNLHFVNYDASIRVALLQSFVDDARLSLRSTAKIFVGQISPLRGNIETFQPTAQDGLDCYQLWKDINAGYLTLTGVDGFVVDHVAALMTGDGYLNSIYQLLIPDGVHTNDLARTTIYVPDIRAVIDPFFA